MQSSPFPSYLVPLGPRYISQHPILENLQLMFLPQCERPRFTPIQQDTQNYNSVYFTLYILGY